MTVIGCTGCLASGKSTLCALLAARGAAVIDVDAIAAAVSAPGGEAYDAIAARFPDVIGEEGAIDRRALGATVFADTAARRALEHIVHPPVERRVRRALAARRADELVVLDHPLLVETAGRDRFGLDGVVVVDVPEEVALARATARGLTTTEARARLEAQADRATRLRAADHIVMNTGTRAELAEMADRVLAWARTLGGG